MSRTFSRSGVRAVLGVVALSLVGSARWIVVAEEALEESEAIAEARSLTEAFQAVRRTDEGPVELDMLPQPLLRFADAERGHETGSLWAWGSGGRPELLVEMFRQRRGGRWRCVHLSLAEERLRVQFGGRGTWTPAEGTLSFASVPDAEPPATSEQDRLRQMKAIAGRFRAHEHYQGERIELRLLIRPLHRYSDTDAGLIDGAMFAFAHGNNPEVILLVEARRTRVGSEWQYAPFRLSSAHLFVSLDNLEVWAVRNPKGTPQARYGIHYAGY